MWWIVLLVGVAYIIIRIAISANKQANAVVKQGGMRVKYRELINHFLEGDSRAQIFQETNTSISVRLSTIGGTTVFYIYQAYRTVTIQWKSDSPVLGKHSLEWRFDEFEDQSKMIAKIENDLGKYQMNVMQKYM